MSAAILLLSACKGGRVPEPPPSSESGLERPPIPPAATNLVTRAQLAMADGSYSFALRAVEEALRRAPHFDRAYFVRGQILTRMDSLQEARTAFESARSFDPAFPAIHFYLGNNAVQRRQYEEALDHYKAEEALVGLETPPDFRCALWMQMGNVFRELGAVEKARESFEKALALDEGFDLAYDAIGQLDQDEGEFDRALEARKKALDLNPESGGYAYHIGSLLYQLGRPEEAVRYLERSRQKLPWFHGSYYSLGRSYIALGRVDEGEQYLTTADSLQESYAKLGLAKATAESHHTPRAWTAYADMLYEHGRYEEALQAYRAAAALDPQNVEVRNAIIEIQTMIESEQGRPGTDAEPSD